MKRLLLLLINIGFLPDFDGTSWITRSEFPPDIPLVLVYNFLILDRKSKDEVCCLSFLGFSNLGLFLVLVLNVVTIWLYWESLLGCYIDYFDTIFFSNLPDWKGPKS